MAFDGFIKIDGIAGATGSWSQHLDGVKNTLVLRCVPLCSEYLRWD
jgi:hypothetical protein